MNVTVRQKTHPSSVSVATVEFQSVLRIRPLKKNEKEDHVVLEPSKHTTVDKGAVALLHPIIHMKSPDGKHGRKSYEREPDSPMFIKEGEEQQFHFDSILDTSATQDKVHYSMGLNMALDAMEPLKHSTKARDHLVVSMGVCGTGKSYTTFGSQKATSRTSGKHTEDGLVLRILESCFSQSAHHIRDTKISFATNITMLYVQNEKVHDMLTVLPEAPAGSSASKKRSGVRAMVASFERGGSSSNSSGSEHEASSKTGRKGMEEVKIEQDGATHNFLVHATTKTCRTVVEAREILQSGLKRVSASGIIGGLVGKNNRGHALISIQPVLVKRDGTIKQSGGTITVLDMAGIERVKKNRSGAMRDSIAINSSVSAVMHCLRTIKHNSAVLSGESLNLDISFQDDESLDGSDVSNVSEVKPSRIHRNLKKVPYLQSKLTMLLQPVFAASDDKSTINVTMILAAYPGHRDYTEKKSLLCDVELLRGDDIAKNGTSNKKNSATKNRNGRRRSSRDKLVRANTGIEKGLDLSDIEDSEDEADYIKSSSSNGKQVVVNPVRDNKSASRRTPFKIASSTKYPSILNTINESTQVVPSNPSAPIASVVGVDDLSPMPPPFAPSADSFTSPAHSTQSPPVEMHSKTPYSQGQKASEAPLSYSSSSGSSDGVTSPNPGVHTPSPNKVSKTAYPMPSSASRTIVPRSTTPVVKAAKPSVYQQGSSTARAKVSDAPNIRPPSRTKRSPLVESNRKNDLSSNTTWTKESPIKAINKVVHASKKKGKKEIQKVENIVSSSIVDSKTVAEKVVTAMGTHNNTTEQHRSNPPKEKFRSSSEDAESRKMLLDRLEQLENQNARLCEQNMILDEKCESLTREKETLAGLLREARMQNRQTDWTALDEEEFHNSRRLRLRDQQLIRSPLRQHLDDVEATYDINSSWLKTGKAHFPLQFPARWTRAPDLDRRDKARELEGTTAPPPCPDVPPKREAGKNKSSEKRKVFENFQSLVKEKKKLRFDLSN